VAIFALPFEQSKSLEWAGKVGGRQEGMLEQKDEPKISTRPFALSAHKPMGSHTHTTQKGHLFASLSSGIIAHSWPANEEGQQQRQGLLLFSIDDHERLADQQTRARDQ